MNTDDNEKMLAKAAMRNPEAIAKRATTFLNNFGRVAAPVKRVKGYDTGAAKAEHRKAKRAKAHKRRLAANASHG